MSEQSRSEDVRRKPTKGQNWSDSVQMKSECVRRKSSELGKKPTIGQNWNEDVRRTSSEIDKKRSLGLRSRERRQDP
jgi:hypothetical protein